jgi:L-asparaginase
MHQNRTEDGTQASEAGVTIITTGGTIDKIYFDALSHYEVGTPVVAGILAEAGVAVPYTVRSLMQKDSLELTAADRARVRKAVEEAPTSHVLITHGTDTMVETARALAGMAEKTIVLTGALKPARFRDTDAQFNVAAAFVAVQILPPGVWIVMNGRVFEPQHVHKNRDANRFEWA